MAQNAIKYYDMKDGQLGQCFIYNCKTFKDKSGKDIPEKSVNNSSDTEKMSDLLTELGYAVKANKTNPTKTQITADLKNLADTQITDHRSFVFYILTHGGENNEIRTSDGESITLTELIDLVDVQALKGKPKIFVVQACRGEKIEKGVTTDDNTQADQFEDIILPITTKPDFLFIFPTTPNYVSWLFNEYGSWFIDMLTTVVRKYGTQKTITDLLQRLIYSVNCLPIIDEKEETWYMQVPCFTSTLTKALVLSKNDPKANTENKLELRYCEEDCIRSRIQVLLQVTAENVIPVFTEESDHIKFSDYCYLLDERTGCYDVRKNRLCFVIKAGLEDEKSLTKAETDSGLIKTAMEAMKFDTKVLLENKTLLQDVKEGVEAIHTDISCLFCYVLTGSQSFETERRLLNEVVGMFKNAKHLLNKPKVFILQAYKTSASVKPNTLTDKEKNVLKSPMRYSTEADVLIIYADHNGDYASFCEMFYESCKNHGEKIPIIDILVSVIPKDYANEMTNMKTAFTSSLKHHLVLKENFKEDILTEDSQRKEHINRLENIADKLLKNIAEKLKKNSATQSEATTYKDILIEGDTKMEKIRNSRELVASNYSVVVAIDLGTTFSGFAWSMRKHLENYQKKEDKTDMPLICTNPPWNFHKTSTCLLLDSERKFVSFGYEAEEDYKELVDDEKHTDYYFFQHFKTGFNEITGGNSRMKDRNGKELPVAEVFSKSLNALVKSFQKMYERDTNLQCIDAKDIKWVLTVPAIWSEQSKQLMRKSAELAGIASYNLLIALEPECASIYCKHLISAGSGDALAKNVQQANTVEKIMVVDLGGETVDVAVHEILGGNKLKEIHRSNHKGCGGSSVDDAFLSFLKEIFKTKDDVSCMLMLKTLHQKEYLDLIRHFETKKRRNIRSNQEHVRIAFPFNTVNSWCVEKLGKTIEEVLNDSVHSEKVSMTRNELKLETTLFDNFFGPSIDKIIQLLKRILEKKAIQDVKDIVLVGGFANSGIVQTRIKSAFSEKRVLVPFDCDLTVLKGAIMYGQTPSYIVERLIPYAYGIAYKKVLKILIYKHTPITEDKPCSVDSGKGRLEHDLYISNDEKPTNDIEKSWHLVGKLQIHVSMPSEYNRDFTIDIYFGGTELKATATDKGNKKSYRTTIKMIEDEKPNIRRTRLGTD